MMLRFPWDSFHRRDRSLARDVDALDTALRTAILELADPNDACAMDADPS
jgi:hypothetical protein